MFHLKKVVLFDIGGTTLISAISENNIIKNIEQEDIDKSEGGYSIIELMKKKLDEVKPFDAISISAPGVIDPYKGEVIHCTDTVKNYYGLNYFEALKEYQVPIVIDNDLNCAALGEYYASQREGSMAQLNVGTGIGAAFIVDGKLYRGSNNTAGEIGNLKVKDDAVDDLCSTRGLVERVQAKGINIKDGKGLVSLLGKDATVDAEFNIFIDDLATLCSAIILLFNPDTLVIGGGLSEANNVLLKPLLLSIQKKVPKYYLENTMITLARTGNNAGLYGAFENIKRRGLRVNQ